MTKLCEPLTCLAAAAFSGVLLSEAAAGAAQSTTGHRAPDWRIYFPFDEFSQYHGLALGLDGRIWATDETKSILLALDERGNVVTTLATPGYAPLLMTRDESGNFFITTRANDVLKISPGGHLTSFALSESSDNGISAGSDGSTWVAEETKIARILPGGAVREYALAGDRSVGGGTAIARQARGSVWFDAYKPGGSHYLASMDPKTGRVDKHFIDKCGYNVFPMIAAPDRKIWAVCRGSTLEFPPAYVDGFAPDGNVARVPWPPHLGFATVGGYNNAIIGPDNAIWIAGQNVVSGQNVGGAFVRFDPGKHTFHKYAAPDGYGWAYSLAFDTRGNLWAGTGNGEIQELILHR
jgi:streptogramin lyase